MLARIDVYKIIKDHFGTLTAIGSSNKKMSGPDFLLFIAMPAIISALLAFKGFTFENQVGNLISTVSIFGGFLFNLLAIIYSQMDKLSKDATGDKVKVRFIDEIHINISFCIILSILLVILLLLSTIDYSWLPSCVLFAKIGWWACFFVMFLFLLTLLMVVNRVYILLNRKSNL